MSVLDGVRPAWEAAAAHVRSGACGECRTSARLPQLCPEGQRMVGEVLGALCVVPPADPMGPAAAAFFEESVRERCAADLVQFADVLEMHGQGMPTVSRDAYWVRYAARVLRDGLAAHILPAPRNLSQETYLTELTRLRDDLFVARADAQAAHEWADALAYRVAPAEVIGRHEDPGRLPWAEALELITPAAEVEGMTVRLLDLSRGRQTSGKCRRTLATGEPCPDHPDGAPPQEDSYEAGLLAEIARLRAQVAELIGAQDAAGAEL